MNLRACSVTLITFSIAIVVLQSACGGGSGAKTATATRAAAATSSASPTSALGIRTVDLSTIPEVRALEASTGGSYVAASALYADITADGIDDAVVPISSGGTLGDLAFLVLALDGDTTTTLLKVAPTDGDGGLSVAVVGGQLVMTQPVHGPDDPNCCPSALRKTTYAWNGTAFTEESVTVEENAGGGGVKRTPMPTGAPQ